MKNKTRAVFLMLSTTALLAISCKHGCNPTPPPPTPGFPISSEVPTDIPGGAGNATLTAAAEFAWQQFIALNWPALRQNETVMRDMPDPKAVFGTQSGPLVWHTFRHKVEIFPGPNSADASPHGYSPPPQANLVTQEAASGYNYPPRYVYSNAQGYYPNGEVLACSGQTPVAQPAWLNVDETSEIGLANMYAGVLGDVAPSSSNSAPQQIRYLAKANKTEYDYVVQNKLWWYPNNPSSDNPLQKRINTWQNALKTGMPPKPSSVVNFPVGTIEVKSAWRPLASGEAKNRFHTANVRYYEAGTNGLPCYWEATWAMVALHIIHKTPSAPYFIFTTFEQADNLLREDGTPVEDVNGAIINAPTDDTPNTPALAYMDSPTDPTVSIGSQSSCDTPGKRLYYTEIPPGQGIDAGTPVGKTLCVNSRYEAIPPEIQAVNARAHAAISTYNQRNNLSDSPWLYYKLVNVQTAPFNASELTTQKDSVKQAGSFYQANIVVETDYTLQQFKGRIANNNAPTSYPKISPPPDAGIQPDFQNVYVPAGNHFETYQMGGCMGCHGNAQVGGFDFSFILGGNPATPDLPTPDDQVTQPLRYRHRKFFSNVPRLTHGEAP